MIEADAQWADIESQIHEAIGQLPDADEFTQDDIGRIVLRARRVNRDAVEACEDSEMLAQDFQVVYHQLIGEIAALMIENARLVRLIEGRAKPSSTYDGYDPLA